MYSEECRAELCRREDRHAPYPDTRPLALTSHHLGSVRHSISIIVIFWSTYRRALSVRRTPNQFKIERILLKSMPGKKHLIHEPGHPQGTIMCARGLRKMDTIAGRKDKKHQGSRICNLRTDISDTQWWNLGVTNIFLPRHGFIEILLAYDV